MALMNRDSGVVEEDLVLVDEEGSVRKQIENATFVGAWRNLCANCSWSTAFQDAPFIKTWWQIYQDTYAPLLVYQSKGTQGLSGLLALALDRRDGNLVVAGAEQSEYKCWLAEEEDGGRFILRAATILSDRFPKAFLRLNFLPAGTPYAALTENRAWASRAFLRKTSRPLIDIGKGDAVRKSLQKKSNKSRMNRLRKRGALRLEVITSAKDLAVYLPQVAEQYDLRQGGLNNVMPFRTDQRKEAFLTALMEEPDLFSASLLMLDDQAIAANLGVRTGATVSVGVFSFSPLFATYSPGKLLLLLLCEYLASQNVCTLDLTPGGAWKERFANRHDEVVELWLHFDKRKALVLRARERVEAICKNLLGVFGLTPTELREAVKSIRSIAVPRIQKPQRGSAGDYRIHELGHEIGCESIVEPTFARDSLARLLDAVEYSQCQRIYLQHCLDRLEAGEHFYAPMKGAPQIIFWIKRLNGNNNPLPMGLKQPEDLAEAALVYRDEAIQTDRESAADIAILLRQIVYDRLGDADGKDTFILVHKEDKTLDHALRELGCRVLS